MDPAVITSHYSMLWTYQITYPDLRTPVLSPISGYSKFNPPPKLASISGSPLPQPTKSAGRSLAFCLTLLLYILPPSPSFSLSLSLPPSLSLPLSLSFSFTSISFTFLQRAPSFVSPFHTSPMDIPQIYATAAGGFFLVFVLINLLSRRVRERIALFVSKHLTYPYFLHRHRLLGPWTRSGALVQLIYIALSAFCLGFRVPTLSEAGLRAGNLSLANMIPLFAGPHLSFLADMLGFRLGTYRRIHRSAGLMSFALLLFHILIVAVQRTSFSLRIPEHLYGMIVCPRCHSRYVALTACRQDRRCVCSCYSPIPSCADPPTKSFFARIKHWPCFPPTRCGVICRRTRCFPACTSTSQSGYFSLRRWSNASASYGGTGLSATVALEPL